MRRTVTVIGCLYIRLTKRTAVRFCSPTVTPFRSNLIALQMRRLRELKAIQRTMRLSARGSATTRIRTRWVKGDCLTKQHRRSTWTAPSNADPGERDARMHLRTYTRTCVPRRGLRLFIDCQVWPNTDTLHSRGLTSVPYRGIDHPHSLRIYTINFSPPFATPRRAAICGLELRARTIFRINVISRQKGREGY